MSISWISTNFHEVYRMSKSPKNKQRLHVFTAYRGRGKQNNDLYLVYSVKTNRDWILPSGRQFVHWLNFLELNRSVRSFDLAPELRISFDDKEYRGTEFDAEVEYVDGHQEFHEVKSDSTKLHEARGQLLAQASEAQREGIKYRLFTDDDLIPHVKTSIRWLKPLGFAAALRDQDHAVLQGRLLIVLKARTQGTLDQILQDFFGHDIPTVIGLFIRCAIQGVIAIDLSHRSFNYETQWKWLEEF